MIVNYNIIAIAIFIVAVAFTAVRSLTSFNGRVCNCIRIATTSTAVSSQAKKIGSKMTMYYNINDAANSGLGKGSKNCLKCKGTGAINCVPCLGKGIDKVNGSVLERWTCKRCKGFGFVPCDCNKNNKGLTPEQTGER